MACSVRTNIKQNPHGKLPRKAHLSEFSERSRLLLQDSILCYANSFYSLFFNKLPLKFSILEVISENDLVLKSEKEMSDVVV